MTADQLPPLDPDIAEMQRRWRESGIPDLYAGRDGPAGRERARNVCATCTFRAEPTSNCPGGR